MTDEPDDDYILKNDKYYFQTLKNLEDFTIEDDETKFLKTFFHNNQTQDFDPTNPFHFIQKKKHSQALNKKQKESSSTKRLKAEREKHRLLYLCEKEASENLFLPKSTHNIDIILAQNKVSRTTTIQT